MLFILYGPDRYRSRKKLNEIIAEYRAKTGSDLNMHRIDMEEQDPATLKAMLEVQSLFAPKKLVIVEYPWSAQNAAGADVLAERMKEIASSKELIVLLWDVELNPVQKKQIAKFGKHANKSQEFKMPSPVPSDKLTIFQLGDAFFQNRTAAMRILWELVDRGEDEFGIFSYLAGHARTLATVKYYADKRQPIPASQKIHPFVAKKAAGIVRGLSLGDLTGTMRRFFEEDVKIKTGLSKPAESLMNILIGTSGSFVPSG